MGVASGVVNGSPCSVAIEVGVEKVVARGQMRVRKPHPMDVEIEVGWFHVGGSPAGVGKHGCWFDPLSLGL